MFLSFFYFFIQQFIFAPYRLECVLSFLDKLFIVHTSWKPFKHTLMTNSIISMVTDYHKALSSSNISHGLQISDIWTAPTTSDSPWGTSIILPLLKKCIFGNMIILRPFWFGFAMCVHSKALIFGDAPISNQCLHQ